MSNSRRGFLGVLMALLGVIAVVATTLPAASASPTGSALGSDAAANRYIVVLEDGADAARISAGLAIAHGLEVDHVFSHALQGFSAVIPAQRLAAVSADPSVMSIQEDSVVSIDHCIPGNPVHDAHCESTTTTTTTPSTTTTTSSTTTTTTSSTTTFSSAQETPTGISRIGGPGSLGGGSVAVAVIDTGIDFSHPDLNVVGGYNCSKGKTSNYGDGHGHGTHVSGTIGAKDNGIGVVGVAPGVPLYAVRVLNNAGMGFRSDIICGIDWVAGNAANLGIRVANMSLGGSGNDDESSCAVTSDAYKKAICNAVNGAGVTFAVAAGNESDDAANHLPAAYDMVITVSALADFDGRPGGLGSATCRSDQDDTFANFSNYGTDVDIIAPGVCILSTWNDGGYNTISGTSMATPHVAGAAAVYISNNPGASPVQVQSALEAAGSFQWDNYDDPDGVKEPLLALK